MSLMIAAANVALDEIYKLHHGVVIRCETDQVQNFKIQIVKTFAA